MKGAVSLLSVSLLITVLFFAPAMGQDGEVVIVSHSVHLTQGDLPETSSREPAKDLRGIEQVTFEIPHNSSVVSVYVPPGARVDFLDHITSQETPDGLRIVPGEFSVAYRQSRSLPLPAISRCGEFTCWEYPPGVDRSEEASLTLNGSEDWSAMLSDSSGLAMGDSILLNATAVEGFYLSMPVRSTGLNVTRASARWNHTGNVTIWLSNDNGTTWVEAANGTEAPFQSSGDLLRLRVLLGPSPTGETASITDLTVEYGYIPFSNFLTLDVEYTLDLVQSGLVWESGRAHTLSPFYHAGTVLVPFVLEARSDRGSDVEASGFYLRYDGDVGGKSYYSHSSIDGGVTARYYINFTLPPEEPGTGILMPVLAFVFAFAAVSVVVFMFLRRSGGPGDGDPREGDQTPEDAPGEATGEDVEGSGPDVAARPSREPREDLLARKEELLSTIKRLDEDHAAGNLPDDVHTKLREDYKARALEIMKELELMPE